MKALSNNLAGEFLSPLYNELRKLAHARVRRLRPGETLQTTDLVHEAYLRLNKNPEHVWHSPRHFFGAAAVAMRDILVDRARYRGARKRGGDQVRVELEPITIPEQAGLLSAEDILTLHTALQRMQEALPDHAELVLLHCFAGLGMEQVAEVMGISVRTAERRWRAARAWLRVNMVGDGVMGA